MSNLFFLLLCIFGGIALLVLVLERVAKPMEPEQAQRLSRWIVPLVGVSLALAALKYFMQW